MEFETWEDFESEFGEPDHLNFCVGYAFFPGKKNFFGVWRLSIAQPRKDAIADVIIGPVDYRTSNPALEVWVSQSMAVLASSLDIDKQVSLEKFLETTTPKDSI